MARILLSLTLCLLSLAAVGQTITSAGSGFWDVPGTWVGGVVPSNSNSTLVSILNGHIITVRDQRTAVGITIFNGATSRLVITSAGELDISGALTLGTSTNRGRIEVAGILRCDDGSTIVNAVPARLVIQNLGTYRINYTTAGLVYDAGFLSGSTIEFTGYSDPSAVPPTFDPAVVSKVFHHFRWNCQSQGFDIDIGDLLSVGNVVAGDFTVVSTSPDIWYLLLSDGPDLNLSIAGSLNIQNESVVYLSGYSGNADVAVTVGQDVNIAQSSTDFPFVLSGSGGAGTLNITGTLNVTSANATVSFTESSGPGTIIANGNINATAGQFIKSGTGIASISFDGDVSHNYTYTGTAIASAINFDVTDGDILVLGATSSLTGTGSFTLNANATLGVRSTHSSGAIQTGTLNGNIRVSGARTYAAFSTIQYDGSAAQFIGNGHPTGTSINTVINNSLGVTLAANTTIGGDLTLTSGNLSLSTRTLTLNGDFVPNSNFLNLAAGSSISIGGSGSFGTFATTGSTTITSLTLNRAGLVLTLGGDLTLSGAFTQTSGDLDLATHLFRINNNYSPASPGGSITGSSGSSFLVAGAGTLPTAVSFAGTIGTLSMNRASATLSTSSGFTVTNLSLLAGTVGNTTSMAIASGGTILRTGSGSLSATPSGSGSYNVTYLIASPTTAGPELPTSATRINNVTIGAGGTLTLAGVLTVNGTLSIGNGGLNTGANNVTLKGNFASDGSGTFTGSTLICDGTTTISGLSIPVLGNLTVNASRSLTMPASIDINGNISLNSTSTFTAGTGTVDLTGSGTQTISAGGKSFNNITVLKSGGVVDILPTLNLIGILDIQSASTVQSNGNLVLVSTSDGTSGNASIAILAGGAAVTGNVVVQRRMSSEGRIFRDISSPVQSATVQQIMNSGITVTGFTPSSFPCAGCATNGPSMYFYTESATGAITNGYTAMTSAGQTLTSGRGYNVLVRAEVGTATMALTGVINSGTINYSSIISFTSTPDATADGWNFVGNPYPSTIDWDNGFTTKTNIQGNMISIWDAGANGYKTWNGSTGSLGSGMIAQGQGFWFQANAAPALIVTENSKVSTTGTFYRKASEPVHTIEIIVRGPGVEDRAYIQKSKDAVLDFDNMDGSKLAFDGFHVSTLTIGENQRKLAINAVGEILEGEIPLVVDNAVEGEYSISKKSLGDFTGTKVSIRDNFTSNIVELSDESDFKFTITNNNETRNAWRFDLIFGDVAEKKALLFPNPVVEKVTVKVTSELEPFGTVLDSSGKEVGELQWKEAGNTGTTWFGNYDMTTHASGLFFVRVKGSKGIDIIKFIKK